MVVALAASELPRVIGSWSKHQCRNQGTTIVPSLRHIISTTTLSQLHYSYRARLPLLDAVTVNPPSPANDIEARVCHLSGPVRTRRRGSRSCPYLSIYRRRNVAPWRLFAASCGSPRRKSRYDITTQAKGGAI